MHYKWLERDNTAHGFKWPLPSKNRPGKWVDISERGEMEQCSDTALHGCRVQDISRWVKSGDLFEMEMDNPQVADGGDKVITQRARLVRRIPVSDKIKRIWACDMAEDVLPIFEKHCPNDVRPRECIEVARRFAEGEATDKERAAAWDAAGAAARAAARAAAWAAAWAAARAAVRDVTGAAARAAAWAAAWDVEEKWQRRRLNWYMKKLFNGEYGGVNDDSNPVS